MTRGLVGAAVAACVALTAAYGAISVYVARRVVGPRRRKTLLRVLLDNGTVRLPVTAESTERGQYGVWMENGAHLRVGEPSALTRNTVTREVLAVSGTVSEGNEARGTWTSQYLGSPEEIGESKVVQVQLTRGGSAEAWEIAARQPDDGRWAIHIHGLRSSRYGAMRAAPPTVAAGWRSLVVSYAGDDECEPAGDRASSLGIREWGDVEDALRYALAQGAREIVLVAWSMGASIARLLLERSSARDLIVGVVLIAPVLDWRGVVDRAVSAARLPRSTAGATMRILSTPAICRTVGLGAPVDFTALNWLVPPGQLTELPVLLLHTRHDPVAPFTTSQAFASTRSNVEVVDLGSTGHGNEPNQAEREFIEAIRTWLDSYIPT